jgi:hypothetical protein
MKYNNKTIISVDIQPEYENYINFDIWSWIEFLNNNSDNNYIVFLYNGADTLGMISEYDYKMWLLEYGLNEDVLYSADFIDKGYAFFRYCMDSGIDDDNIVSIVKYMYQNNINDSRDIDEDMWMDFMEKYDQTLEDVRELLEYSDDLIHIPDVMDNLKNYDNIVIMGGGMNECLKEIEIALMSLDKPYEKLDKFIY